MMKIVFASLMATLIYADFTMIYGMKGLPRMDREKEDAGKKLLKSMLE